MNLPNWLTTIRIALVPVMLFFLLTNFSDEFILTARILALVLFAIASITDALDGYFARKEKAVTKVGRILDPLADKLLISGALIAFLELGLLRAWPVILIIAREFAVTGLRLVAVLEGVVIPASNWGKLKTVLQILTITVLLLANGLVAIPRNVTDVFVWLTVVVTLFSGFDYFRRCKFLKSSVL